MNDIVHEIFQWIRSDWRSHPWRFCVELVAWAISLICSVTMAVTVPDAPLLVLYPLWISGCAMYSWAAYSRKSFGMLANYILLTGIDTLGLIRLLMN